MNDSFKIPILFLIFNRPDTTQKVFNEIKKVKPSRLFIASDGPRNYTEKVIVEDCRNIISQIDWDCKIETLYRDQNLGCKIAVSSAIDWFFIYNEMGIILEDDCVPHTSFFPYCEELLIKYKDEDRVMQISGFNPIQDFKTKDSYCFAKFGPIWGWATWKRAWERYDINMTEWPRVKEEKLYKNFCDSYIEQKWRVKLFDRAFKDVYNTWDYQWSFAKLLKMGLNIISTHNLINNIGFGESATHTSSKISFSSLTSDLGLRIPLTHPKSIKRNKKYEHKFFVYFILKNMLMKVLLKIMGK